MLALPTRRWPNYSRHTEW